MATTDAQRIALALCPKFTAFASVVGSGLIIADILVLRKRRKTHRGAKINTRHRLLLGMSVCDVFSSAAWFLTSWPMPPYAFWTVWQIGNQQTCSAQGFFVQWSAGTVWYYGFLILYYLLVIRYGWSNQRVSRSVEPFMHVWTIGFAVGTSIAGLALGLYNPVGWNCAIQTHPPNCTQSWENKGPSNCIRGDNADIYRLGFWLVPACAIFLWTILAMFLIFVKVRRTEQASREYTLQRGQSSRNQQRRVAIQAAMYVSAMLASWIIQLALFVYWYISGKNRVQWYLSFFAALMLPAQGLFNALIYFHNEISCCCFCCRRQSAGGRGTSSIEFSSRQVPPDVCPESATESVNGATTVALPSSDCFDQNGTDLSDQGNMNNIDGYGCHSSPRM